MLQVPSKYLEKEAVIWSVLLHEYMGLRSVWVTFFSRNSEDYSLCSLYHKGLKTALMYILRNGIRRT